ncbi:MAG: YggS family pyridoxal phosphate enzyme, partial [Clostridia bacterium]|nr:YggS family pyridoxal phosphate enzyme [Clostridia bacterium]
MSFEYIDKNTAEILERVSLAKDKSEHGQNVKVIAAVKYCEDDELRHLTEISGITEIGENRVQELLRHYEIIDRQKVNIHFIGSLQTNKVKYIIDKVSMIHSLDSIKLAKEIDKQAEKHGLKMDVLVEINCGKEENKGGILPEDAEAFCREIMNFQSLNLCGCMTMAPKCEKKSDYLKFFDETYKLFLDIWRKIVHNN